MRIILFYYLIINQFFAFAQKNTSSLDFELIDNRPFITVKINEYEQIFHFVLDCGAVNVIDEKLANTLKLTLKNKQSVPGVGENRVFIYDTTIDSLKFGDHTIKNEEFISLDLSEIKHNLNLPYLDGIIGYDFFRSGIIEFDYLSSEFKVHNNYDAKNGIPFNLFHNQIPLIEATINGIKGNFIVDTGDRSAITIRRHFYEKFFKEEAILSDTIISGYSIGGPIYSQQMTLDSLTLGGQVDMQNINARVLAMKSGRLTTKEIDGSIGGGILKRYRLIIDYNSKKMQLLNH